ADTDFWAGTDLYNQRLSSDPADLRRAARGSWRHFAQGRQGRPGPGLEQEKGRSLPADADCLWRVLLRLLQWRHRDVLRGENRQGNLQATFARSGRVYRLTGCG